MAANDVIVVLPGIMGSVLQKDGHDAWNVSLEAVLRATFHGRDLHELALKGDSPTAPTLDDGVVATEPVRTIRILPGVWKVDGYTRILEELAGRLGIAPENRIAFPYDWRRDNRAAAARLKTLVDAEKAKRPGARVFLAGHSMGGLVSRYYTEVLGGWKDVAAVFTIATPHRGSVKAIKILAEGVSAKVGPITVMNLTDTLRTFTSLYQLLPIYQCVEVDGALVRVGEAPIRGLDRDRVLDGLAFHREIERHVQENLLDAAYRERFPLVLPIVGTNQPTLQSARVLGDGKLELLDTHPWDAIDGDGTVPRVSATPLELSDQHREVFVAGVHGSLQNASGVLDQIAGFVSTGRVRQDQFRALECRLGIDLEDAFLEDETVTFRVRPSREPVALLATIEDGAGARVAAIRLRRASDGWHRPESHEPLRGLSPGYYRVRVEGRGAEPLEDVFAVLESRAKAQPRPKAKPQGVDLFRTAVPRGIADGAGAPAGASQPPPAASFPAPLQAAAGPKRVTRWPGLEATDVIPGGPVVVTVSLTAKTGAATSGPAVPATAGEKLTVRVASEQIAFEPGDGGESGVGTIEVSATGDSSLKVAGKVAEAASLVDEIEIRATFLRGTRPCGAARRAFAVVQRAATPSPAPAAAPTAGAPAAAPAPAARPAAKPSARPPASVVSSGVVWDPDDDEASLTIDIAQSGDRELRFSLHVCSKLRDKADLPGRLSGTCQLKGDPSAFMSAIYAEVETRAPGDHLSLMEGVGTRIYRATPDAFKQAYAAIDAALEADELAKVTVQIATEDAHIPWELMFLPQGKRPGEWLGVRHPVARWPADRSGQLRPRLGGKHIAALVPSYAGRNALKFAQCEAELLAGPQFAALTVAPATKARARDLLAAKLSPEKPIGILHFAGHGRFDPAGDAAILLEDGKLLALDVDTSANTLGEHDRTVVFMNACQTGRTGALLEGIGGWAETWLARGYRGFIAPLWSVVDDSAYLVTKRFYELALGGGVPVAEALRQVRGEFAPQSHTYLSYVYFGDVTARF